MRQQQALPSRRARKASEPKHRCRLDLVNYIPYRISVIAALVRRALSEIYKSDPCLTEPEWKVMTTLAHYGPLPSGDIGLYVTLDRVAVSRALNKLIERGLASRTEYRRDQRMFLVDLTPEAADIYDRMAQHALDIEHRIFSTLAPEEAAEFLRLLDKVESCFRSRADRRRASLIQTAAAFSEAEPEPERQVGRKRKRRPRS